MSVQSRGLRKPASPLCGGVGSTGFSTPLVYTQNYSTPPPSESPVFRRAERFSLQSVVRSFLPDQRVAKCLRVPTQDHVKITHNTAKDSFGYRNLETCSSVWMCPVCQAKISEKRRLELVQGVGNWREMGCSVALLTLTVQHHKRDTYAKSLNGLSDAFGRLLNRKTGKKLMSALGVVGRIRALEATYGENGWHPHFHVLLFLKTPLSGLMLAHFETAFSDLWRSACFSSGLNLTNNHGCTLKDGTYAAQYVSKWGIESEITKGHIKKSKTGYSPNDLLRFHLGTYTGSAVPLADGQARALFKEYAFCMKGKKQLHWSRGLRDLLGLTPEKTDEELNNEVEIQDIDFAKIPLSMWKVILKAEQRAQVLESCRSGIDAFFLCCRDIWLLHEKENQP